MHAAKAAADSEGVPDARRGHLKVFIGMAAGVGKTYRMLQEGHTESNAGRDVAIGYMEPHKRPETSALAEGLETVPRRRVAYRDTELEEMDLPALLARAPELALIDELAHTNAPGVEHDKRYEDVREVLAAGIDVFSTVNVQHLESLNDQVAELTGTRVRETIPDAVLGEADEVVLIDLTPEALVERLRAGKVYPGESIEAALNNFFTVENLLTLREVALRQVAQEVEAKRLVVEEPLGTRQERVAAEVPKAVGERLLALVRPEPASQRLVRRAWRSAQRLGTDLDLLWVKPPNQADRGGGRATGDRAAPPRLGSRRHLRDRGERQPRRWRCPCRPRARHHLHHARRVPSPAGPGEAEGAAAAAVDEGDATGSRRADRCRQGEPGRQ